MRNVRALSWGGQDESLSITGLGTELFKEQPKQTPQFCPANKSGQPKPSLTPTIPKERKTKIFWTNKQKLKIMTIYFSKINIDYNVVPDES